MSIRPHSIHHTNFPCSDVDRTAAWYEQVFGMRRIDVSKVSDTPILLLTFGNFDLHFTPHQDPPNFDPHHFCIEVEDWDFAMQRLAELGIGYTDMVVRPQNSSKACYIRDPDGNIIELMNHANWDHDTVPAGRVREGYNTKVEEWPEGSAPPADAGPGLLSQT